VRDRIRASPPRATARRGVPTRRAASSLLAVRARNAPAGCGGTGERVRRPVPRVGCEAGQGVPLRTRLARVVNTYCLPSFSAATGSFTTYSVQRQRGEGASGWGRLAHNRLPTNHHGEPRACVLLHKLGIRLAHGGCHLVLQHVRPASEQSLQPGGGLAHSCGHGVCIKSATLM
jgi:hypothetical protein